MLIDDIDLQTFTFSNSGWPIAQKTPDHWDQRAEKWRKIAPRLRTATCNN